MQPLVLAIEPDLRQAAIVKRIVREKVLADVAVVDSRDAALEAMRTKIPDVLLLSALLSPRDEDELIAHLRTLQHAEHLQTHTIPQLASTIDHDDDKPRGLLSAFRRRKASGSAPAGCDPDLFADEIRTYLQRAAEKKRDLRDNPVREATVTPAAPVNRAASPSPDAAHEGDAAQPESSWASPFEWRPARAEGKNAKKPAAAERESRVASGPAPVPGPESVTVPGPESVMVPGPESVAIANPESVSVSPPESVVVAASDSVRIPAPASVPSPESVAIPGPDSLVDPGVDAVVVAAPNSVLIPQPRSVLLPRSEVPVKAQAPVPRRKLPLSKRHAREWWFEGEEPKATKETASEMRAVLASLSVPLHVAAIGYAQGCRIRRVRVAED